MQLNRISYGRMCMQWTETLYEAFMCSPSRINYNKQLVSSAAITAMQSCNEDFPKALDIINSSTLKLTRCDLKFRQFISSAHPGRVLSVLLAELLGERCKMHGELVMGASYYNNTVSLQESRYALGWG